MRAFYQRVALVLIGAAALAVVGMTGWRVFLDHAGGAFAYAPEDAAWLLSDDARALIAAAFEGLEESGVVDHRVAVISRGQLGDAQIDNESFYRADHAGRAGPLAWVAGQLRLSAAGVHDVEQADAAYVSRLLRQVETMPAAYRLRLLARDWRYHDDGSPDTVATYTFVANDYVYWLAQQAPDVIVPVVSIHPYRADALAALEKWAARGVTAVSWQPVRQNIDLRDPRALAFYHALAEHDMALQLRVGAIDASYGDGEGWVDPLALRAALGAGITVIASVHGGGEDRGTDLTVTERLLKLLRGPSAGHLRIDLSGTLAGDALANVLAPLLQHPQFYRNLRYASGYPRSAINARIDLGELAERGFILTAEIAPLREIYDVNPLMFAFVTLRTVRLPHTRLRLPDLVFAAGGE